MDLGLHVIVLGQFHVDAGLAVALVLDLVLASRNLGVGLDLHVNEKFESTS